MSSGDNLRHPFHKAWTMCVGQPGYDKKPWRNCLNQLDNAIGVDITRGERSRVADVTQFEDPINGFNAAETFARETPGSKYNQTDWDNARHQLECALGADEMAHVASL